MVHPAADAITLPGVLHALGDPARLAMLTRIAAQGDLACGATCADLPRSTVTHHLRILREAGLITTRREGTMQLNSLRRADLDTRFPGLLDAIFDAAGGLPTGAGIPGCLNVPMGAAP